MWLRLVNDPPHMTQHLCSRPLRIAGFVLFLFCAAAPVSTWAQVTQLPNPFDFLAPQPVPVPVPISEAQDLPADTPAVPPASLQPAATAPEAVTAPEAEAAPAIALPEVALPEVELPAELQLGNQQLPAERQPAGIQNAEPGNDDPQQDEQPAAAQPAVDQPPVDQPPVDAVLTQNFQRGLLIEVEGPIFDRFHWYLNHRLDLARKQGCDLILIRLTSPGGDLEHSLQLARRLRDIDWATTIVFIPEEAISGGAIMALGCDRIYMQSGALLGDAGPIRMGLGGQFEHAEEKVVSYTVSAIRELATSNQRPAALAEAMVDRTVTVYQAIEKSTGRAVFLSEKEFDEAGVAEKYELGAAVPEAGQNRFLTVGGVRARELQLCEGVFNSQDELLQQLSIEVLESTRINWIDKTVFTLNRPWLTALLLIIGLVGLYLELAAPGISIAGLASMVCFGIFFWSHFLGGTSGWLEVLLFIMGIVCLAFELFVLPGFGIFGLSGLFLLVLSLVMASQDFLVPANAAQWQELQVNLLVVLGAVLGVMVLFFGQILLLDSIPGLNRFRLDAPEANGTGEMHILTSGLLQSAEAGRFTPPSIGATGVAESDLRPAGKVLMDNRLLDVITEGDYVEAGSPIEVLRVEGNRIVVRKR
jgi:membrane-bound serine protease (ClpP class)